MDGKVQRKLCSQAVYGQAGFAESEARLPSQGRMYTLHTYRVND
ncbi:MAG TPA: hypothetical protein VKV37_05660 [Ktedonobacteraceae bacterium]|jgi:hypothetical protein|nr:hypothetical protein [Ktedonobacteraceae bacterium]